MAHHGRIVVHARSVASLRMTQNGAKASAGYISWRKAYFFLSLDCFFAGFAGFFAGLGFGAGAAFAAFAGAGFASLALAGTGTGSGFGGA
jgi:hypothetical protein